MSEKGNEDLKGNGEVHDSELGHKNDPHNESPNIDKPDPIVESEVAKHNNQQEEKKVDNVNNNNNNSDNNDDSHQNSKQEPVVNQDNEEIKKEEIKHEQAPLTVHKDSENIENNNKDDNIIEENKGEESIEKEFVLPQEEDLNLEDIPVIEETFDFEIDEELQSKLDKIMEAKDNFISSILLAEFDIDKGSTLTCQFPKNLQVPKEYNGNVDYFDHVADLMLPDGSQNQEWDQTVFILNRPPPKAQTSVLWDLPMDDEPAIEELELLDSGSKLVASISQPNLFSAGDTEGPLFGLNVIYCKKDSAVRRGATIKAICILSKFGELIASNPVGSGLVPILRKILVDLISSPRKAKKLFFDLYSTVNPIVDLSRYLNAVDLLPNLKYSFTPQYQTFNCEVMNEIFPIVIPYTNSKDVLPLGSLYTLLRFIGLENTMELYHAVLMEKKIIFLGHNFPIGQLCKFVLSSSILVGAAVVNLVLNRIFPYVTLTDLSFESVAGFIVGTTNPMMLENVSFDVLVNLNDRTVTWKGSNPISLHLQNLLQQQQQSQQQKSNNPLKFFKPVINEAQKLIVKEHPDNEFMRKIEQGFNLRLSERWLQQQFSEYTIRYIDVALGASDLPKSEIDLFSSRSILVASTNWFNQYYSEGDAKKANGFDVAAGVRQLVYAKKNLQFTRAQKCEAIARTLSLFNSKILSNSDVLLLISYLLKYTGEANLQEEIDLVEEFSMRYSNMSMNARKINLRMQNLLSSKISPLNSV